jgi:hypothetical protein
MANAASLSACAYGDALTDFAHFDLWVSMACALSIPPPSPPCCPDNGRPRNVEPSIHTTSSYIPISCSQCFSILQRLPKCSVRLPQSSTTSSSLPDSLTDTLLCRKAHGSYNICTILYPAFSLPTRGIRRTLNVPQNGLPLHHNLPTIFALQLTRGLAFDRAFLLSRRIAKKTNNRITTATDLLLPQSALNPDH